MASSSSSTESKALPVKVVAAVSATAATANESGKLITATATASSSSSSLSSSSYAHPVVHSQNYGSFSYIGSLGLKGLQMEPQRLLSESNKLNEELEALVLDNYRVFVDNLACSVQLRNEDKLIVGISDGIRSDLSSLSNMCLSYREKVYNYVAAHKRNRKTLQYHMQLVELLEVPQLVDACARNGFYDEALELANFISSLARRHVLASETRVTSTSSSSSSSSNNSNGSNNNSNSSNYNSSGGQSSSNNVIQSIVDEVYDTLIKLRIQLLQILTDNLSLSKEIQITSTLRKLDSLLIDRRLALVSSSDNPNNVSESEKMAKRNSLIRSAEMALQMDFLEARTIWMDRLTEKALFESLSAHINSDANTSNSVGPYGRAIEILEINRSSWFSVITQFKALFSEDQSHSDPKSEQISSLDVLTVWTNIQVHRLLASLNVLLYQIEEGASLRSLMEQALGFAARMSQVGCDFSPLILSLFENIICDKVLGEWNRAAKQFKSIIINEKMTFDSGEDAREQIVPLYFSTDDTSFSSGGESTSTDSAMTPTSGGAAQKTLGGKKAGEVAAPSGMICFPPLAYFMNSLLVGVNFLRDCPLKSISSVLISKLGNIFEDLTLFLADNAVDIKSRGIKYLSGRQKADRSSKPSSSAIPVNQSDSDIGLAKLYAKCYLQNLVPHVILALELVFPAKAKQHNLSMPFKVENFDDMKGLCSDQLLEILSSAWSTLESRGLWPLQKNIAPLSSSSSSSSSSTTTPAASTTTPAASTNAPTTATTNNVTPNIANTVTTPESSDITSKI